MIYKQCLVSSDLFETRASFIESHVSKSFVLAMTKPEFTVTFENVSSFCENLHFSAIRGPLQNQTEMSKTHRPKHFRHPIF